MSNATSRSRPHWFTLAAVAALVGLGSAGGTYALWNSGGTVSQAQIVSGDLEITSSNVHWRDTSSEDPQEIKNPETHLVRPGDTVSVEIPLELNLEGDNMQAELNVVWESPANVPTGVSSSYAVLDADGAEIGHSPMKLGEQTLLDLEQLEPLSVRIDLDFADLPDRFGADSADTLNNLSDFTIVLEQVRGGGED
ncbi:alternate-type signal peptide domain-containing protein [Yaniella halotolerans]|uniref:alternate-type signal peptide domain-containing protein n=1 Tax=Yaniella halotolerans TaxID=225453 RepID=UPI0003B300FA|nr:alternate-type signal peptide domain-containing protein [Yaniella halotolerans]